MKASKLKLFIGETDNFSSQVLSKAKDIFEEVELRRIDQKDLTEIFDSYDIFWFRLKFSISKELIRSSKRLKIIATAVTGIDHINLKACQDKNIKVISLKGENEFLQEVRATAEHTIGLTLALLKKIPQSCTNVMNGNWNRNAFRGHEIYKKNVGIIGFGRLGKIVAGYFSAFGANVFINDINVSRNVEYQNLSIKEIFEKCDIVSIHVDLNENTTNLIDKNYLNLLNENKYLINTSRGSVINEKELLSILNSKKIGGVALDVIQKEDKVDINNGLIQYAKNHDNLILTPHTGGNTFESFDKTEMFIYQKMMRVIESWK